MATQQPEIHFQRHLRHLAAQGKLLARDDIAAQTGGLCCGRDQPVSTDVFDVLLKTQPVQALQNLLYVEGEFREAWLLQVLSGFINADSSFADLFPLEIHRPQLQEFCGYACEDAGLRLRLTALSILYPTIFDRCLFSAAFGFLVYCQREKDTNELRDIFVTGLYHEIGLLEIDEDLQCSQRRVSREDNRAYYQHAVLGAATLARAGCFDESVIKAVEQHHEHLDGTGFPRGLQGLGLSEAAQVIHLLNNLYIVYQNYFKPRNRTLADTIPIIEMNSVSRFGAIAKSLIRVLSEGKRSSTTDLTAEYVEPVIEAVRQRYDYIGRANKVIENFTQTVGFRHDSKELFTLQNAFIHIAMTLVKSANINEGYMRWLDQVEKFKLQQAYREIEDTFLMMNEVLYHIEKFREKLAFYRDSCKDPRVKACVEETLAGLNSCELPGLSRQMRLMGLGKITME